MNLELPILGNQDWDSLASWGYPFGQSDYVSFRGSSRTYESVGFLQNRMIQNGDTISNSGGMTRFLNYQSSESHILYNSYGYPPETFSKSVTQKIFVNTEGFIDNSLDVVGDIPEAGIGTGYGLIWGEVTSITHTVVYQEHVNEAKRQAGSATLSGVVDQSWLKAAAENVFGVPDESMIGLFRAQAAHGEVYGPVTASTFELYGYDISGDAGIHNSFPHNDGFTAEVLLVKRRNLEKMGGFNFIPEYMTGDVVGRNPPNINPGTGGNIPGTRKTKLFEPITVNKFRDSYGTFDAGEGCLDELSWVPNWGTGMDALVRRIEPVPDSESIEVALGLLKSFSDAIYRVTLELIEIAGEDRTVLDSKVVTADLDGSEITQFDYHAPPGYGRLTVEVSKVERQTTDGWQELTLSDSLVGPDPQANLMAFLYKSRYGSRWGFRGFGDGAESNTWYLRKSHMVDRNL